MTIRLIVVLLAASFMAGAQVPMKIDVQNSASYRWLNKEVHEFRVLDNMENSDHWNPFTTGAITVVDARATAKPNESKTMETRMHITGEKYHGGNNSLQIKLPTKLEGPGPKSGRGWGTGGVFRIFENEDWSKFDRISLWIYPDNPGFYQNWLELRLYNDGSEKLPALFGQEGETTVLLRNHEWNQVVWEISNVSRDKISKLEIASWMPGNEPEATDTLTYYFDDLKLEKVDPDYIEGWNVWPGRISLCHTGYQPGAPKTAIATDLPVSEFSVINDKGEVILSKPIQNIDTHLGKFQLLDFSEIQKTGSYVIKAGETVTKPFEVDSNVWEKTLWKALNFFYVERCGMTIPGAHGPCHRDWICSHGDKSLVINGGWHDAGDFTQGLRNTGEAVYAMFSLADKMNQSGSNQKLCNRLIEEANWGLDWILKTRFGDGYRNEGSINSRRTDGIIGDFDDVTSVAKNTPKSNFIASAAEAIAFKVLKESDSRLANYSLKAAEADWEFAVEKMIPEEEPADNEIWTGTFDSGKVLHDVASAGILASVTLWQATGDNRYEKKAVELAGVILQSQQREIPDWDVPFTGFFYISPAKKHILHYCHNGREQEPIAALTQLCEAFPAHPDWMKWYSAVVLHSEYLKKMAKYTEPYSVMPSSIYTDEEYISVPESRRESFRKQVLNGIPLGKGHYLRLFPVWMDYRGHFGTILPQAQSLSYAAHLRGDDESAILARHQMEWVTGRNPFSQSTMYGEGYDFTPLYTPSSGDIVGALPVGIQTRAENDIPYWPVQSTWTYKEVWVHPVSQWIALMRDLEGTVTVRPDDAFSFEVEKASSGKGEVTIKVRATGNGNHQFSVRTYNLTIKDSSRKINLHPGETSVITWHGRIDSTKEQWVVVIEADNDLASHKELIGPDLEK